MQLSLNESASTGASYQRVSWSRGQSGWTARPRRGRGRGRGRRPPARRRARAAPPPTGGTPRRSRRRSAARDVRIAAADHPEVAPQHAVRDLAAQHEAGLEEVARPEGVERRRGGEQLGVGGDDPRLVGVVGVDRLAGVELDDVDAERRGGAAGGRTWPPRAAVKRGAAERPTSATRGPAPGRRGEAARSGSRSASRQLFLRRVTSSGASRTSARSQRWSGSGWGSCESRAPRRGRGRTRPARRASSGSSTTCSASTTGTLVSLAPWRTIVGAFTRSILWIGERRGAWLACVVRVAVLDRRDRRHPGLGVREEGLEVDDAEEVRAGGEEVGVLGQAGHRHVAAVGAAHDADACRARRAARRRGSRRRP